VKNGSSRLVVKKTFDRPPAGRENMQWREFLTLQKETDQSCAQITRTDLRYITVAVIDERHRSLERPNDAF
jgi:hypothetical protein